MINCKGIKTMNLVNIANNTITIISFIVNLCFIFPFSYKVYKYFTQKRYIKKVLSYTEEPVQIYQSTFEFNTVEGKKYDFITYKSLESI